jgi:PHD/YefM family antitoxin component YafN of YafNO toxin-antitoxin module
METKIGVREFRAKLPAYLESESPVTITRHGETLGYYIPVRCDRKQIEIDSLKAAVQALETMMAKLKISEEDIVSEFKTIRNNKKI